MKIFLLCPRSFGANTYLLVSDRYAVAVDPCVSADAIRASLKEANAELLGILLTHGHFDHTASVDTLRDDFPIPLIIHADDAEMLTNGMINGFFDFYMKPQTHRHAEMLISDGETLNLGNEKIRVIHTPGHSRGSCCFLCKDDGGKDFLISGDTLFADNIGRCDLYGGDESKIIESLKRLSTLDHDTLIYPGHGASARLGDALRRVADAFDIQDLV